MVAPNLMDDGGRVGEPQRRFWATIAHPFLDGWRSIPDASPCRRDPSLLIHQGSAEVPDRSPLVDPPQGPLPPTPRDPSCLGPHASVSPRHPSPTDRHPSTDGSPTIPDPCPEIPDRGAPFGQPSRSVSDQAASVDQYPGTHPRTHRPPSMTSRDPSRKDHDRSADPCRLSFDVASSIDRPIPTHRSIDPHPSPDHGQNVEDSTPVPTAHIQPIENNTYRSSSTRIETARLALRSPSHPSSMRFRSKNEQEKMHFDLTAHPERTLLAPLAHVARSIRPHRIPPP